jgi:DNA-binding XRE family transcriptional regulator/quercetin dioxygenase-like cupin family protein
MLRAMTNSPDTPEDGGSMIDKSIRELPPEAAHKEIGARLRAERKSKGLTLRALAEEVGVSPSAISQIETGRSKASVNTLYALVERLGVSLDSLFSGQPGHAPAAPPPVRPAASGGGPGGPVCHPDERQVIDLEAGVQWQRLTRHTDPSVDFLYVIYAVGGASSLKGAFVRHPGREYGLVQQGRLQVSLGFETYELGPGDSISFDSTTPHRLENIGDEPVHAVWFSMGRHEPTG